MGKRVEGIAICTTLLLIFAIAFLFIFQDAKKDLAERPNVKPFTLSP